MAETPKLNGVQISPDGAWVTYTVTRRSVAANTLSTQRFLQRVPRAGEAVADASKLALPEGASVQWRPDSRCLSLIVGGQDYDSYEAESKNDTSFVCYDITTGAVTSIPTHGRAVSTNYQWSPRGNYVAFAAPLAERAPLDPRRGVPHGLIEPGQFMALFVLDVRSGKVTQLTPDSMNVSRSEGDFAFAPDERALAVAVDLEMNSSGYNTDLVAIDLASRRVRPLVTRAGMDAVPRWSPDGRSIAFATHCEDPTYFDGWPAIVRADGGRVIAFPQDTTPTEGAPGWWAPDSRAFYYKSYLNMTQALVRADLASRTATVLPSVVKDLALAHQSIRSVSKDGRWMAFTRESFTTPAELLTVALDANGQPIEAAQPLVRLAPDFMLGRRVRTEALSWPSPDGRFTIHALLLTPASAHVKGSLQGPLPTLLYLVGGPSMVLRSFANDGWNGTPLALAARGYAVLIPNTRGRDGYGLEFRDAIRNDKNRGRDPLADALAGLDLLIGRGIADPDRTGVLGHSYGGYLTAYTITQTNRFKAAVMHEATPLFMTDGSYFGNPNFGISRLISRDLFGIHNPFDVAERARLIEESPGLHADRVRTPTMLLSGGKKQTPFGPYGASFPSPVTSSIPFYNGLRRFNVPASLFVYDEGHVTQLPAAIADELTRTAEWLDYWVRDLPFPDPVRAKEYGR